MCTKLFVWHKKQRLFRSSPFQPLFVKFCWIYNERFLAIKKIRIEFLLLRNRERPRKFVQKFPVKQYKDNSLIKSLHLNSKGFPWKIESWQLYNQEGILRLECIFKISSKLYTRAILQISNTDIKIEVYSEFQRVNQNSVEVIFSKGDNFCDGLFSFLLANAPFA